MMKLGVIVNIYGRSSVEPIFVSPGAQSYKQFVSDTRSVLYNLNSPHKEQGVEFFDIVRIEKDVVLLVLNKYIPGPDGNVLSAMITIPDKVHINGKELNKIVQNTKKILRNIENYEQLKKELEKEFDEDYEEKSFSKRWGLCTQNSNTGKYAYRKYGKDTGYELYEILDSLFQNYYSQYEAVFLIDATSTITPTVGLEDLTTKKIMKDVVLLYPNNLPKDVSIKVNNQPFSENIGFKEEERVLLEFSRSGFESITEEKVLQGTENSIKVGVSNLSWKVVLRRNMFNIHSIDYPKTLTNVSITVKGKPFYNSDFFSESELKEKTEIIVKCDGYEDYKKTDVLLKDGKNPSDIRIDVPMVKKKITLKYKVKNTVGKEISFTLEEKDLDPKVSPLAGYRISSNENRDGYIFLERVTDLSYSGSKPQKWAKILIVIICVFACIGVFSTGMFVYTNITHKPIDNPDPVYFTTTDTTENKENTIQEPPKLSLTKAEKEYLQNHTDKWDSIEMSKQSKQLAKLYFDVNNRHYEKIKGQWDSLLSALKLDYWDKIVTAATNPKAGKDKAYCKDGKITIEQYLQMTGNDFSGPEGKKKAAVQQSKAGNVEKEKTEEKKGISSFDGK